jgi:ribonuclease J
MREQARFALSEGVRSAVVQRNGDIVRLAPKGPKKVGDARTGRLVLDGDVILPADGATINERRKIAINGIIAVALSIGEGGRLNDAPMIRPFGVPVEADRDDFLADAADAAAKAYDPSAPEDKQREAVRLAVRRCATLWTGKKPLVEIMLVGANRP